MATSEGTYPYLHTDYRALVGKNSSLLALHQVYAKLIHHDYSFSAKCMQSFLILLKQEDHDVSKISGEPE